MLHNGKPWMLTRRGFSPWVGSLLVRTRYAICGGGARPLAVVSTSQLAITAPTRTLVHAAFPTAQGSMGSITKSITTPVAVMTPLLQVSDPVQEALLQGRPVVALESTIVAHGMPYPQNLELSHRVAAILRNKGVEPATIAVKDGVCRVGLSRSELEDLAKAGEEGRATKCSTRELSLLLANTSKPSRGNTSCWWGATTVASTMTLAHLAGIPVFVTGGIGGVHRHGEVSMDISADLTELSRTPVIVISAGIKSILDIPRTLEVLETNGVPTVAYQTDEFPAFFSPHSGVAAPARMDSAEQVARAFWAARALKLSHGMLVAVPNQDPAGAQVEDAIQSALVEAEQHGIHGQAVTPFLLKRVAEKTAGESLRSNMALVERNAAVGAEIALAVAMQRQQEQESCGRVIVPNVGVPQPRSRVVVMGGVALDLLAKPVEGGKLIMGTSNPASCKESDGGVARNIAEVLGRLGSKPLLYSVVGKDSRGLSLLSRLSTEYGIQASPETVHIVDNANTATYIAVMNEKGDLHTACADMAIFEAIPSPPQQVLDQAEILVLDANPPVSILHQTALYAKRAGVKVFLEPTSVAKALAVAKDDSLMSCLTFATPSVDELSAMADGWSNTEDDHDVLLYDDDLSLVKPLAEKVIKRMNSEAYLIVTVGAKGCLLTTKNASTSEITFQRFPAEKVLHVMNATGAGDTLAGAFVHALLQGKTVPEAVVAGIKAATLSLECSDSAISPSISDLAT